MSDHRDANSGTNATKEDIQSVDADAPINEPQMEQTSGAGANDNPRNQNADLIQGEDTEKAGIKAPDAMGAGA